MELSVVVDPLPVVDVVLESVVVPVPVDVDDVVEVVFDVEPDVVFDVVAEVVLDVVLQVVVLSVVEDVVLPEEVMDVTLVELPVVPEVVEVDFVVLSVDFDE